MPNTTSPSPSRQLQQLSHINNSQIMATKTASQPPIPTQQFPLMSLAPELHLIFLIHLPICSLLRLRLTSHYFLSLIPPPITAQYLSLEQLPSLLNRYLTCNCCARFLPSLALPRHTPHCHFLCATGLKVGLGTVLYPLRSGSETNAGVSRYEVFSE